MQPYDNRKSALLRTSGMLIACVMSLTGCGETLPKCQTESAVLPVRPSISTPLPQQSYSSSAQTDIQSWRARLTGTAMMSKP